MTMRIDYKLIIKTYVNSEPTPYDLPPPPPTNPLLSCNQPIFQHTPPLPNSILFIYFPCIKEIYKKYI